MEYGELRDKYRNFIYKGYTHEIREGTLYISFSFEIEGLSDFTPEWKIPVSRRVFDRVILDRLVFSLGMTELVSYWKITCSPNVYIKCGDLSEDQALWWKKLYIRGLGEFFYKNGIEADPEDFMTIHTSGTGDVWLPRDMGDYSGTLVPIGGGKDSAVSLEILRGANEDVTTYTVNATEAAKATIDVFGAEKGRIGASRTLDPRMIKLNKDGFLNGHTPFSAIVAFSSYIAAYMNGLRYIALSNESSANEPTVAGSTVNHQYSKSYEFEEDFMTYIGSMICDPGILYFSLLRPLLEIQIAGLFAKYKQYHKVFRSCNRGSKKGIWCCDCSKCLFVYIILSPFLSKEELTDIFGEDLLNKESLNGNYRALTGLDRNKPFECVGTRDEVALAVNACSYEETPILILQNPLPQAGDMKAAMRDWNDENNVPWHFAEALREKLHEAGFQ